jgi:hypothetical protein
MIFPIVNINNNRNFDESLELRYLKLTVIGFFNEKEKTNFSFDIKLKQILKNFIKNNKLANKVIENKYMYFSIKEKRNYSLNSKQFFGVINNSQQKTTKTFFQMFLFTLFNTNSTNKNTFIFSDFSLIYKRFINLFGIINTTYNDLFFFKEKLKNFKIIKIKKTVYSIQIFDKMIKLITKIVLVNSKFFFLNNIKYNYTLLKFCDKTMKLVNSILLFCLLCDINIPYYCFHSDLSIAGNCRMCLVQLDTSLKPIASCAVSIGINSTIYTNTKIIQKAREGVLEFLLINHPLDCPICDQGGECDLQEQFITYGNDRGRSLKKMI